MFKIFIPISLRELSNISLDLDSKTNNFIQSTFNQLRFSNDNVKLSGLSGKLLYSNEEGKILLRSLLKVTSNIFKAQLGFDNLVSEINFDIQNGRINILPSYIFSIFNGQELEGQFRLTPTPTSSLGILTFGYIQKRFPHYLHISYSQELPP